MFNLRQAVIPIVEQFQHEMAPAAMSIRSERCAKLIRNARRGINHGGKKPANIPVLLPILLLFVFTLAGIYVYGQDKIIRVYDGISFSVFTRQNDFRRVRLYGIKCPNPDEPWGKEAKSFTSAALFLKKPALTPISNDEQGLQTVLAQLPDGRLLNEELLRNGYAQVDRAGCVELWCGSWLEIERRAKNLGRGLWSGTP
jgi:endonuclease YncB( thermonuclease family)